MSIFRYYLLCLIVCLGVYTAVVGTHYGWNLLPVFFGDMAAMTWPGQFNLDFMMFLSLSAHWLAWRHHFSTKGIVLGVLGYFGGMMVLAPYLIIASIESRGNAKVLLLGKVRANA